MKQSNTEDFCLTLAAFPFPVVSVLYPYAGRSFRTRTVVLDQARVHVYHAEAFHQVLGRGYEAGRIHGHLGGIEAGGSEVREASECSAATVGHRASRNEALRRYEWQQ